MTTETWRPHPTFTSYEVSDQGQVRSIERTVRQRNDRVRTFPARLLKPTADDFGYLRVTCSSGGIDTKVRVHVLVCEAFHGPRPPGDSQVRHLNGNHLDNRASNLQWGTRSENVRDSIEHGTHNHAGKTECVNGHKFTPENTVTRANGSRRCRTCARANSRRSKAKARAVNSCPGFELPQQDDEETNPYE